MEGIIYRYISPSNKCYIGQTVQGDLRKQQHKYNAFNGFYIGYNLPFYCAIRKYGFDSFQYEILNTINEEDIESLANRLNELEVYYIGIYNSYNNGYNASVGGLGLSGKDHPSSKKVAQYTLEGEFLTVFDSAVSAARSVGLKSATVISKCCNYKYKSSGGFQWRYAQTDFPEKLSPIKRTGNNTFKTSENEQKNLMLNPKIN